MYSTYLVNKCKSNCFGCEACVQACSVNAIRMIDDEHMFRYPYIDEEKCINCGNCRKVCPVDNMPEKRSACKKAFGGYIKDESIRNESTSGGAFSSIVELWCDGKYAIFGAEGDGIEVHHSYCTNKSNYRKYRKSKYSQSRIDGMYSKAKEKLSDGYKVIFSGTPCQIAGFYNYLGDKNYDKLLTVDVICEGVPSPLYVKKYNEWCEKKYKHHITDIDYRYTGNNKWDFEVMRTLMGTKELKIDRWFNPFWSIWLNHLMSRPSCYYCPFASINRVSDISLGDLWGVHLYCPELYGKNGGSSLVLGNTQKGIKVLDELPNIMFGHELDLETVVKYQSPLRNHISYNNNYTECMDDLSSDMDYMEINKKWAKKPGLKLLFQKYIWGNRQKVYLWNIKQKMVNYFQTMSNR